MEFACIHALTSHLYDDAGTTVEIKADLCPPDMAGDITVNCFRIASALKRNPMQIAKAVNDFLAGHEDVDSVETVKAFVNVTLNAPALFRDTVADSDRIAAQVPLPESERRRILIEYSAPNTNKPLHLGHVRNNTLGMSLCALLARVGHHVTPVNLVNDRGVHICKSMLAYQRFGDGITPESAEKKGDHLIGDYYVRYDKAFKEQLETLRAERPELAGKSADDLFLETEIGAATQELLVAWEDEDTDVRALWRKLNDWVLSGFDDTYKRMGVKFEKTYFESDIYTLGKAIARDALEKGIFQKRADGATIIDLEDVKLGSKVVLRADGTSVYMTQDLGVTVLKNDDYTPDTMVWVVADEQIHHFKVLFAILKKLGHDWADNLHHLAYGMVNLPEGKMKSREGTVVDADDLFDEMHALAKAATLERCGDDVPEDIDARAEIVGMGALKFMLLKVSAKSSMTFDPQAAIKFEGDTGAYVQNAYVRISSIRRKQSESELAPSTDWALLGEPEERVLALRCAGYPDVLHRAAADLDCAPVAGYLLELARDFHRFYKQHSVLSATTPELCRARLSLCERVQDILREGLGVLTIDTLEAM